MPKAHLVGIGGIGMSSLARYYLSRGWAVQGTDLKKSELLSDLEKMGARVLMGHDPTHVDGADRVVYSSSIPENHPERLAAVQRGIPVFHRSQALAEICEGKCTIAVTGTHGKTTTTALIGMILKEAGRDPSVVVGGEVNFFGGNAYFGQGPEIVIEADESDSSFLAYLPFLEVITNIEEEHMDHFLTVERMENGFRDFIRRLPEKGKWFGCAEDARLAKLAKEKIRRSTLYGFNPADSSVYATDVTECPDGRRAVSFKAWKGRKCLGTVELKLLGKHNVLNALAAVCVGLKLEIPFPVVQRGLERYEGAGRRFDVKYEDEDTVVVDDYAHHPTEIRKTLAAARALKPKRVVALFQPHRYTRTESLLKDFGIAFTDADKVLVTEIYAANESPLPEITGERVCREISNAGHPDVCFVKRAKAADSAREILEAGDLFIALGAGDIWQAAEQLADVLKKERQATAAKSSRLGIFGKIRGRVIPGEPLSKHTSLKVGGPAEFWVEPKDPDDLKRVLEICSQESLPVTLLGAGSNVLPPDEGVKGAVLHLAAPYFCELRAAGGKILARAGVPNSLFIQYAVRRGFGGCEFLSGIPGNIGGAIAMNAGSHKQSIDSLLETVTVVGFDGIQKVYQRNELFFGYRHSSIAEAVIVEGMFALPVCEREEVQKRLDQYRDYRMISQDLQHPSAGCMFKNPKDLEWSSGKLIEDTGMKGRRIGRAQVSTKHANFIVNLGGASARDVRHLIEEVRGAVKRKFNVDLETEVKIL